MSSTDDRHGDQERENALAAAWTKNHPKPETNEETE